MRVLKQLGLIFSVVVLASFFCLRVAAAKVNPILTKYVNLEVERITSNVVDASVNEILTNGLDQELFVISKNRYDEVEMIDYDTKKVNLLLKEINQTIRNKLVQLEEGNIDQFLISSSLKGQKFTKVEGGVVCELPLAALTGNGFFTNLGPSIPLKMSFLGQVKSSLKTKVTDYGINNLYLELSVHVEIRERVTFPKVSQDKVVKIDAPLSIKIIQGVVPEYYGGIIDRNSQSFSFPETQ